MSQEILAAPIAKTAPHTFEHLARSFTDHYAWLQDKTNPEVIAYLEAENAYATAVLKHTEDLQEQLFKEMRGRIKEDDSSVPQRRGDYFYYWRMETGQQYRIFCRKHGSLDAEEQILLDENKLAEGLEYCRVQVFEPGPDQRLLAYSVDMTGSWEYTLFVVDIASGERVAGPIERTGSAAWASDNRTLFYTVYDSAHRPAYLYRLDTGGADQQGELIYHEPDESFNMLVHRTRSGAYVLMTLGSHSTSEVRYLPADNPGGDFQIIQPRKAWMEYYVEHQGDRFLIRTNDEAVNFKLMRAPVSSPGKDNWQTVIAHRPDVLLEDVEAFESFLVAFERKAGLEQIRISPTGDDFAAHYVSFPEPVYTIWGMSNPVYESDQLRFGYSSLVTPNSTIEYDMRGRVWQELKRDEIPSGYDPDLYESMRLTATAADGAKIPISLVYRKGIKRDGLNPLLLYGYGSYGYSMDPAFDTKRFSLIDRGFVYAIAHIRGGSEMGREWYEQGRLMHKKNSFTDFIACAEYLITEGYTTSDKLSIMGGSAGGLLVAAVMNMCPDLCRAVIAAVPFTNVITAMLSPELPLTVSEYEQWGNPNDSEAFDYMLSYSPYENVEAKAYPHVYVKTGINDLQVPYWDPAKWVARLRELKTDDNRLVMVTNMGAGHGGASGRFDYLKEIAQIYAFLLDVMGAA